jgi:tRNA pseudouridine55 synthase
MAPGWDLKVYWGDVWFGVATTTDDSEGDVVAESNPSRVDLGAIERALGGFVGDIVQEPPAYSAIRVGGRRAYEGARRGDLARPPARPARIDAIWVVGWTPPLLSLLIQCRSGTYVRSLARDLGQSVGCPAHLSALVRTRVGPFGLDDALRYDQLEAVAQHGAWNRVLWPTDVAAAQLDVVVTGELEELGFGQGRAWPAREYPTGDVRVFSQAGRFLGLASQRGDGMWRPRVVLESAA